MTQEERLLLLRDLCTRLPYGVRVKLNGRREKSNKLTIDWLYTYSRHIEDIKPYLRPMSSMTEEETEEYRSLSDEVICNYGPYNTECKFHCVRLGIKPDNPHECIDDYLNMDAIDWLNAHHFDYRGLIEKGLALEAPKDMYNTK